MLLDWVGTARMDTALVDQMSDAGVTVCKFRPLRPWTLPAARQPHASQGRRSSTGASG